MDIVKVTSVLELFFAFNKTEASDSLELIESPYDDKYFRWTKDTFKHKQTLTAIYSKRRIDIFKTEKVRDRLLGNQDKIKSDKEKENFGCVYGIVSDIVVPIYAEEITDEEIIEFEKENEDIKNDKNTKRYE